MRSDSQSPLDELTWSLWTVLMCMCDACERQLELAEFDGVWEQGAWDWAVAAAPTVEAAGWVAPEGGHLLCPDCVARIDSELGDDDRLPGRDT